MEKKELTHYEGHVLGPCRAINAESPYRKEPGQPSWTEGSMEKWALTQAEVELVSGKTSQLIGEAGRIPLSGNLVGRYMVKGP